MAIESVTLVKNIQSASKESKQFYEALLNSRIYPEWGKIIIMIVVTIIIRNESDFVITWATIIIVIMQS